MEDHLLYMRLALEEAKKAGQNGEVPIGAILVSSSGEVLAKGANCVIRLSDPTAHAEILALRRGAALRENYRLPETRLYVTIEPCIMCMGAIVHARVGALVYGARDPKWGAAGSLYDVPEDHRLNHRILTVAGVMEDECRALIQRFFRERRN